MLPRPDNGPTEAIVFLNHRGRVGVCYDDGAWETFPEVETETRGKQIVETSEDEACSRIQCVLLGKHQDMLLPSGFLRGAGSDHSVNGWEVYRAFDPPPVFNPSANAESRYASPTLPFQVRVEKVVKVSSPGILVPCAPTKRGATPPKSPLLPIHARVITILIGVVYNSTRERVDKRRWLLLRTEDGKLFFTPMNSEHVSEGSSGDLLPPLPAELLVADVIAKAVAERSPASLNSSF
eukprot:3311403-Pleurochrysis_carterae.AAC.1